MIYTNADPDLKGLMKKKTKRGVEVDELAETVFEVPKVV